MASPSQTQPPAEILLLDYQPVERVAAGNYGQEWKAKTPTGKMVTLKILNWSSSHPGTLQLQSVELLTNRHHTFLLDIYDYSPKDLLVISMRLARSNLNVRLRECRQQWLGGISKQIDQWPPA